MESPLPTFVRGDRVASVLNPAKRAIILAVGPEPSDSSRQTYDLTWDTAYGVRPSVGIEYAKDLVLVSHAIYPSQRPADVGENTPRFCPVDGKLLADSGSVFCEAGEYNGKRYEAEGNADVYACPDGHRLAWNPPVVEDDDDEERCSDCRSKLADGEGYDGRCGNCADVAEAAKETPGCGEVGPNGYCCTHHSETEHIARGNLRFSFFESWPRDSTICEDPDHIIDGEGICNSPTCVTKGFTDLAPLHAMIVDGDTAGVEHTIAAAMDS